MEEDSSFQVSYQQSCSFVIGKLKGSHIKRAQIVSPLAAGETALSTAIINSGRQLAGGHDKEESAAVLVSQIKSQNKLQAKGNLIGAIQVASLV